MIPCYSYAVGVKGKSVFADCSMIQKPVAVSPLKNAAMKNLKEKKLDPRIKLIAGMCGGLVEGCLLQPLDVTKTRLQLDRTGSYGSLVNCAKVMYKEEGYTAFYKGIKPFLSQLMLKYSLRFGSFAYFQGIIKEKMAGTMDPNTINFTAGLATGILESCLIVTPFEVVKTRMQKEKGVSKLGGPINVVKTIVTNEGPLALWKGNIPTCIRQGSNQAFNFMAFAWLAKNMWGKVDGGPPLEMWQTFVSGLMAAVIGPCMNAPMDVLKTRLMAQETIKGQEPRYKGFFHAFGRIAREEGIAALWKGLTPRLIRLAPGQAITWTVVMKITALFEALYPDGNLPF